MKFSNLNSTYMVFSQLLLFSHQEGLPCLPYFPVVLKISRPPVFDLESLGPWISFELLLPHLHYSSGRAHLGLNFTKLCCKWGQILREGIRNQLINSLLSPQAKSLSQACRAGNGENVNLLHLSSIGIMCSVDWRIIRIISLKFSV